MKISMSMILYCFMSFMPILELISYPSAQKYVQILNNESHFSILSKML
jgi:hypothetical protein